MKHSRLWRALPAIAVMAALSSSAAHAGKRDCDAIRAIMEGDTRDLARLSLTFTDDRRVDLRYGGKPTPIKGANDCTLASFEDNFELTCSWDFKLEAGQARGWLDLLRVKLRPCLVEEWRDTTYRTSVEGLRIVVQYESEIEDEERGSEVTLKLYEFLRNGTPTSYDVDLTFERD